MNWRSAMSPARNFVASVSKSSNSFRMIGMTVGALLGVAVVMVALFL